MLEIYHAPGTRAFRVIWACEELGVGYRLIPVDMSTAYRASEEWRRLNPVGKVPVMTDGALTMFESGAMVQYVLDRYGEGRLQPATGTPEHALYLQWSWFAESTFARPLGEIVNHRRAFPDGEIPEVVAEMQDRGRLSAEAVASAVAERAFLLGDDISGADLMMGYTLMIYRRLVGDDLPGAAADYWLRLSGRDAFARTVEAEKSM